MATDANPLLQKFIFPMSLSEVYILHPFFRQTHLPKLSKVSKTRSSKRRENKLPSGHQTWQKNIVDL